MWTTYNRYRVKKLIATGFHFEAVMLLNAILDYWVRESLIRRCAKIKIAPEMVLAWGHRRRLAILKAFISAARKRLEWLDGLWEQQKKIEEIYRRRNIFIHDLFVGEPNESDIDISRKRRLEREIENLTLPFIDHWENSLWENGMYTIGTDENLTDLFRETLSKFPNLNKRELGKSR